MFKLSFAFRGVVCSQILNTVKRQELLVNRTSLFPHFANWTSSAVGHPITFASAVFIILLWALTGSFFKFSDTWQLVINTGTNLVTFLVAFLVLNTQNCDSAALQLKLDELIRSMNGVHNSFLDIENMSQNISGRSRCASKWLPKLPENTCMVA